jgi:predicted ATPase
VASISSDEPEAALSTQNCLTCVRRIHELVSAESQFVIATDSPIILAYLDSVIYVCTADGVEPIAYDDTEPVQPTRSLLESPDRFLRQLLSD